MLLNPSFSQVSINTAGNPPDASAMLDVSSDDSGILIPRMGYFDLIAISSPANGLMIYQTDFTPGIRINSGTPSSPFWVKLLDPYDLYWIRNGGLGFTYLSNNADSLGIGTTITPTAKLQVKGLHTSTAGTLGIFTDIQNSSASTNTLSGIRLCGGSSAVYKAAIYFQKQASNKGRVIIANDISGDGSQVSVSDAKILIDENGDIALNANAGNGNELYLNGEAYKTSGNGSWQYPSDNRLKDIDGDYSRGISEILQIQPVYFRYKENNALGLQPGQRKVGLIAQDVQKVIPEAVGTDDKGYLMLNNDPIMHTMLNAIKEQQAMIEELKKQNLEFRDRISTLEGKIEQ